MVMRHFGSYHDFEEKNSCIEMTPLEVAYERAFDGMTPFAIAADMFEFEYANAFAPESRVNAAGVLVHVPAQPDLVYTRRMERAISLINTRRLAARAAKRQTAPQHLTPGRAGFQTAVSGQTAAAQHTSTGGSNDDDPAPSVQSVDPVAPDFVKNTQAYLNRLASAARAKKIEELAAAGKAPKAMDLTPALGNCDAGIGHESILHTLSRDIRVDPDPLDRIIPDPYRAAAEAPNAAGKSMQLQYHRFLRKAILVMRNPVASPVQKIRGNQCLLLALPGLLRVIKAHCRKWGLVGVDVDGVAQHLIQKLVKEAKFDEHPNQDVPHILYENLQTIDQAITFSNFSTEDCSHQDAARFTDRPAAAEDDDEGPDPLDKAVHQQYSSRQRERGVRELWADGTLDPSLLHLHDTRQAESHRDDSQQDADATTVDTIFAAPDAHEETNAERRARQTADERRAIALKHRLLDGLQAMPEAQRGAAIQGIAQHLARHPDPLLLTLIRNDVDLKSKKARDPVAVQLLAEVSKTVKRAEVEAIAFKPKPSTDMDAGLVLFAGLPAEDARARALDTMAALRAVMDDTQQHVVDALRTRARNARGIFPKSVQQGATSLLNGAGYSI